MSNTWAKVATGGGIAAVAAIGTLLLWPTTELAEIESMHWSRSIVIEKNIEEHRTGKKYVPNGAYNVNSYVTPVFNAFADEDDAIITIRTRYEFDIMVWKFHDKIINTGDINSVPKLPIPESSLTASEILSKLYRSKEGPKKNAITLSTKEDKLEFYTNYDDWAKYKLGDFVMATHIGPKVTSIEKANGESSN